MASSATLDLIVQLEDRASKGLASISKTVGSLGKFAAGAALGGGIAGVTALTGVLAKSVSAARESNIVMGQTDAVLKSTGMAAGVTAQQVSDLAGSLSAASGKSLFGDEQIQSAENMTLTFTAIGKEVFPQVTQTAVDMAQALHTTPEAMAQMTGKALSSVQGITALRKIGVQFTDDQVKMAKQMMATGDTIGYQKLVLGELAKEFGGSAAAAAAADGGFAQFSDQLGEMAEGIGKQLMPAVTTLMGFLTGPDVQAGLQSLADGLVTGVQTAIGWLTTTAIPAIKGFVGNVKDIWGDIVDGFNEGGIEGAIGNFLGRLGDMVPAIKPITTWLEKTLPKAVSMATTAWNLARDAVTTFIDAYNGNWQNSDKILLIHQIFGEIGTVIGQDVVPALETMAGWIDTIANDIASGDFSGAWDAFASGLATVGTIIGNQVATWASQVWAWLPGAVDTLVANAPGYIQKFIDWISTESAPILTQLETWGAQFAAWVPGAIQGLLDAWPDQLNTFLTWIGDQAGPILTKLGDWGVQFAAWVLPAIPDMLTALAGLSAALFAFVVESIPVLLTKIDGWSHAFYDWVMTDAWPKLAPVLDQLNTNLGAKLNDLTATSQKGGEQAGNAMRDGFVAGAMQIRANLDPVSTSIFSWLNTTGNQITANIQAFFATQTVPVMLTGGRNAVFSFVNGLAEGQTRILPTLNGWATAIFTWLNTTATSLYTGGVMAMLRFGLGLYEGLGRAISGLSSFIGTMVSKGLELGAALVGGILSGLGNLGVSLAANMLGGLAGALGIVKQQQKIHSPSKLWAKEVGEPIAAGIAQGADDGSGKLKTDLAKSLTDAINGAAEAITKGVQAFGLLANFVRPDTTIIQSFASAVSDVTQIFINTAANFKAKAVDAAGVFADGAGKVLGIIGNGVAALTSLQTYNADALFKDAVYGFASDVKQVVNAFWTVADSMQAEGVVAAGAFAENAAKVLGIIGNGVQAIAALRDYDADGLYEDAVIGFASDVKRIVNAFWVVADSMLSDGVQAAATFAEGAGKVLGIISTGVKAIADLQTYNSDALFEDAVIGFAADVKRIVNAFWTVADSMMTEGVAAAAAFADGAGKVISIIGPGVEGLVKLRELKSVPAAAMDVLVEGIKLAVQKMGDAAKLFTDDFLAPAVAFADAAGKVIAPISTAIDTFGKLKDYKGVLPAMVELIVNDIKGTVGYFSAAVTGMMTDGVAAAATFAQTAGQITGFIGSAVDTLSKVAGYKGIDPKTLQQFFADLTAVMTQAAQIASTGFSDVWSQSFEMLLPDMTTALTLALQALQQQSIQPWLEGINIPMRDEGAHWMNNVADGARGAAGAVSSALQKLGSDGAAALQTGWGHPTLTFTVSSSGTTDKGLPGNPLASLVGGKRASGGPVAAGVPYLVGENRPEVFVPNVAGRIVSSVDRYMADLPAPRRDSGGNVTSVTNHVYITASDTNTIIAELQAMGIR